ncbi:hypothetical protein KC348_g66 [Hortaea werneckii]|nr:hypothetical protein KC348_g66 [Hortaea werneckii]
MPVVSKGGAGERVKSKNNTGESEEGATVWARYLVAPSIRALYSDLYRSILANNTSCVATDSDPGDRLANKTSSGISLQDSDILAVLVRNRDEATSLVNAELAGEAAARRPELVPHQTAIILELESSNRCISFRQAEQAILNGESRNSTVKLSHKIEVRRAFLASNAIRVPEDRMARSSAWCSLQGIELSQLEGLIIPTENANEIGAEVWHDDHPAGQAPRRARRELSQSQCPLPCGGAIDDTRDRSRDGGFVHDMNPRLSKIEGHGSRRLSTMKEREHIHPWRKCHSKHRFHCWLLAAEAAVAPIARIFDSQRPSVKSALDVCTGALVPAVVPGGWVSRKADVEAEVVAAGTRASWGREFRNRPPAKRPKHALGITNNKVP